MQADFSKRWNSLVILDCSPSKALRSLTLFRNLFSRNILQVIRRRLRYVICGPGTSLLALQGNSFVQSDSFPLDTRDIHIILIVGDAPLHLAQAAEDLANKDHLPLLRVPQDASEAELRILSQKWASTYFYPSVWEALRN